MKVTPEVRWEAIKRALLRPPFPLRFGAGVRRAAATRNGRADR